MQPISLVDLNYLLFIIPGFMLVWTFRFFNKSEKVGEFEFAGLSFFWGMMIALFAGLLSQFSSKSFPIINTIEGFYAVSAVFSIFSIPAGFVGAWISNSRIFKWILNKLSSSVRN